MIARSRLFVVSIFVMVAGLVAVATGVAVPGDTSADVTAGSPWACAGAQPVAGVCLDSPLESLDLDLL